MASKPLGLSQSACVHENTVTMPDGGTRTFRMVMVGVKGDWAYLSCLEAQVLTLCCVPAKESVTT